ncbi:hypothetical protein EX895_005861 [Sporisorium graminicola]|uniref:Uncharacterized protein n=1 Tax=Sporisorium graminicola TaxID=280036 RepID=A0A4U7KKV3_9BASI|nr:hypothetical protein EX895_005861 [Sporisorium graminicola]TKY84781.1 hypothetical protein EX895_005861 [Sporisorium graminicola]
MLVSSLLLLPFLTCSLLVSCDKVDQAPPPGAAEQDAPPTLPNSSPPVLPTVYTPVVLNQLCQDPANYCIYVDQNRPGTVRASPVNATDAQGAFLFERAAYTDNPFHVCYGGCCIDLDFAKRPGCVAMRYVSRPGRGPGHLLARFADNIENLIGPRDDMRRLLEACPQGEGMALPYAVIGARGGHEHHEEAQSADHHRHQQQQQQGEVDQAKRQQEPDGGGVAVDAGEVPKAALVPAAADPAAAATNRRLNHDYFDDVRMHFVDGW